ncbi:MAG TPA: YggS family pyridoxal phosphate-dependent enzyme [Chryseosolibacter sp.]|nr:YggS family pyridoxal phosphate-dependent enzyme [Chryseosolibacter sp.]
MGVTENLAAIKNTLPPTCTLVAVTKTHPVETIMQAYDAGHKVFGENKVQEMRSKAEVIPADVDWHMIGHLQSNKVKHIVPFVSLIHGVDSIKLLEEINKQAAKIDRVVNCLLQIHIAEEESKFGFSEEELDYLIEAYSREKFSFVNIRGLMGMATLTENEDQIRKEFKQLKQHFDEIRTKNIDGLQFDILSMGMSADYQIAIEEGSTMIRVGSAIFGGRTYH